MYYTHINRKNKLIFVKKRYTLFPFHKIKYTHFIQYMHFARGIIVSSLGYRKKKSRLPEQKMKCIKGTRGEGYTCMEKRTYVLNWFRCKKKKHKSRSLCCLFFFSRFLRNRIYAFIFHRLTSSRALIRTRNIHGPGRHLKWIFPLNFYEEERIRAAP